MMFEHEKLILFVCCVNRDRSVIAEKRLGQRLSGEFPDIAKKMKVVSAGIIPGIYLEHVHKHGVPFAPPYFGKRPNITTIQYLSSKGIDVTRHLSREIDKDLALKADLILTMDYLLREEIIHRYPTATDKVYTFKQYVFEGEGYDLNIGDPWAVPSINPETGLWHWPECYIDSYTTDIELCLYEGMDKIVQFIES